MTDFSEIDGRLSELNEQLRALKPEYYLTREMIMVESNSSVVGDKIEIARYMLHTPDARFLSYTYTEGSNESFSVQFKTPSLLAHSVLQPSEDIREYWVGENAAALFLRLIRDLKPVKILDIALIEAVFKDDESNLHDAKFHYKLAWGEEMTYLKAEAYVLEDLWDTRYAGMTLQSLTISDDNVAQIELDKYLSNKY